LGRFAASVAVAEDATTVIAARAHRIGGQVSGLSEPLAYTHPDVPLLELEVDGARGTYLLASHSKINLHVTAPAPAVDWSLFPFPNCVQQSTSWGSSMSGTTDRITLASGHINLGPEGTETGFSARVVYSDGSQSGCSNAAVYVRQSSSPAVVPWLLDPSDPSYARAAKARSGHTTTPSLRLATTAGVSLVSLFGDGDCTSDAVATRSVDANPMDVTIDLVSELGVALPDDAVTVVPISVAAEDAEAQMSTCVAGLTYTYDPVPPAPPTFTGVDPGEEGAATVISGTAEAAATVTVFAGAGCDACGAAETTGADGSTGAFEVTWGEASGETVYSAHATDAAGNTSDCAESALP
ncbi:MAG: Ig-like domain-containing protein, partial [Myxococcota bacterium]|nr:Ig-like domain-containing protein [Myxococcota bacterium]